MADFPDHLLLGFAFSLRIESARRFCSA
jgi:hypothetical protein